MAKQEASTGVLDLQAEIRAEIERTKKTVAPSASNRISTNGKKFTLPNGQSSTGPLLVVVLDHRNINRYYTKAYDPNNPAGPDCFAIAKEFANMSPENHESVASPQATACDGCPRNEWGSAAQGKGKACRNMVRLALGQVDGEDGDILTLEVPPTAIKHWTQFVNDLSNIGRVPAQVVCEIAFDDSKAFPCPTFKAVKEHDEIERFWAMREKAQSLLDQEPAAA